MTRGAEIGSGGENEEFLLLSTSPPRGEIAEEPEPDSRKEKKIDAKPVQPPALALLGLRFLLSNCKLGGVKAAPSPGPTQSQNNDANGSQPSEKFNGVTCDSNADSVKPLHNNHETESVRPSSVSPTPEESIGKQDHPQNLEEGLDKQDDPQNLEESLDKQDDPQNLEEGLDKQDDPHKPEDLDKQSCPQTSGESLGEQDDPHKPEEGLDKQNCPQTLEERLDKQNCPQTLEEGLDKQNCPQTLEERLDKQNCPQTLEERLDKQNCPRTLEERLDKQDDPQKPEESLNKQDDNQAENNTPKVVKRGRRSMKDQLASEAGNIEEGEVRRMVTRHSLSKQKKETDTMDNQNQNGYCSSTTASANSRTPSIKMMDCSVKVYRCDYKLRVNSQFQFTREPTKVDERKLIKTLQKLKGVIEKKLEERKQQNKVNDKRGPLRNTSLSLCISTSITAPPTPKAKLKKKTPKPQLQKCQDCSEVFPNQFQLRRHVLKWHYGRRRPYPCELCGKAFFQRTHLYNHMRIHTGETPFSCKVEGCSKAFTQNGSLIQHMRTHPTPSADSVESGMPKRMATNGASFSCSKCSKTFASYFQRQRHVKSHHRGTKLLYRCARCEKCCSSIRLLKLHCLRAHVHRMK